MEQLEDRKTAQQSNSAHGNQQGGSLHTVAQPDNNGFMSAADKVALDAVVADVAAIDLSEFLTEITADALFLTPAEGNAAYQAKDTDLTTIAGLADPNADRILFWDDSAGSYSYLATGTGISISGTTITPDTSSETAAGISELSTNAEAITGTATNRVLTPANLAAVLATLSSVPPGVIVPYAAATEPTGWLLCYGQAVSRTTYAALFAVLNTDGLIYGVGDGSTTFNLPDARGRVVAGQDDMGGTSANRLTGVSGGINGDTLGGTGGSETHALTIAQLAAHTHTINAADASGSGTLAVRNSAANGTMTTNSTGSGTAHNNVQPTIIFNYIIKT